MAALPPKLYFRIGEVAGLVGVEPHVLRYWEREFRSIRPTKSAKGQRVYSRKDVEALLVVKDLLYSQGFTIAGAKKRLTKGPSQEGTIDGAPPVASAAATAPASLASAHTQALAAAPAQLQAIAPAHAQVSAVAPAHAQAIAHAHASPNGSSHASHASSEVRAHAAHSSGNAREKLSALRSEVEAFLRELGG
jgi:DNA-binding transcriptional MerR regulator